MLREAVHNMILLRLAGLVDNYTKSIFNGLLTRQVQDSNQLNQS